MVQSLADRIFQLRLGRQVHSKGGSRRAGLVTCKPLLQKAAADRAVQLRLAVLRREGLRQAPRVLRKVNARAVIGGQFFSAAGDVSEERLLRHVRRLVVEDRSRPTKHDSFKVPDERLEFLQERVAGGVKSRGLPRAILTSVEVRLSFF